MAIFSEKSQKSPKTPMTSGTVGTVGPACTQIPVCDKLEFRAFNFPVLKEIRESKNVLLDPRIPGKNRDPPFALLYRNTINNKRTNNKCIKFGTNRLTNKRTLA